MSGTVDEDYGELTDIEIHPKKRSAWRRTLERPFRFTSFADLRRDRVILACTGVCCSIIGGIFDYNATCHLTAPRDNDNQEMHGEEMRAAPESEWFCPQEDTADKLRLVAEVCNGVALLTTLPTLYLLCQGYYYEALHADGNLREGESLPRKLWAAKLFWPLVLELVTCAVCPVPYGFRLKFHILDFGRNSYPQHVEYSFNELATIFIHLRMYLLFRAIGLHLQEGQVYLDPRVQRELGSMGGVRIKENRTMMYALRSFFFTHPLTFVYLLSIIGLWFHVWAIWVIERNVNLKFAGGIGFAEAVYGTVVTCTTVGYGDTTAVSSIGRAVFMSAAVCGTGVIALLVAAITAQLELSISQERLFLQTHEAKASWALRDTAARCIQQLFREWQRRERKAHPILSVRRYTRRRSVVPDTAEAAAAPSPVAAGARGGHRRSVGRALEADYLHMRRSSNSGFAALSQGTSSNFSLRSHMQKYNGEEAGAEAEDDVLLGSEPGEEAATSSPDSDAGRHSQAVLRLNTLIEKYRIRFFEYTVTPELARAIRLFQAARLEYNERLLLRYRDTAVMAEETMKEFGQLGRATGGIQEEVAAVRQEVADLRGLLHQVLVAVAKHPAAPANGSALHSRSFASHHIASPPSP